MTDQKCPREGKQKDERPAKQESKSQVLYNCNIPAFSNPRFHLVPIPITIMNNIFKSLDMCDSWLHPIFGRDTFGWTKFGPTQIWFGQIWSNPLLNQPIFGRIKFGQTQIWSSQIWSNRLSC